MDRMIMVLMKVSSDLLNCGRVTQWPARLEFLRVIRRRRALRLLEAEAIRMPACKVA